jgi:hypothetical protein
VNVGNSSGFLAKKLDRGIGQGLVGLQIFQTAIKLVALAKRVVSKNQDCNYSYNNSHQIFFVVNSLSVDIF